MLLNCDWKSLREKSPVSKPFYAFKSIASDTVVIIPFRSPNPSNRLIKLYALNGSKSSKCSPVPIKIIGLSVAATALRAPPPLACPSSLVIITEPTLTAFLNANA